MLPNIPTDNLYKFVALTGIALFIYSVTFPIAIFNRNMEKSEGLSEELAGITADIEFLNEDIAIGKSQGEKTEAAIQRFRNSRELRRQNAVFGEKLKALRRLNVQTRWIPILSAFGAAFGSVLAVIGLWLWYRRLQRPLDMSIAEKGSSTGMMDASE